MNTMKLTFETCEECFKYLWPSDTPDECNTIYEKYIGDDEWVANLSNEQRQLICLLIQEAELTKDTK